MTATVVASRKLPSAMVRRVFMVRSEKYKDGFGFIGRCPGFPSPALHRTPRGPT